MGVRLLLNLIYRFLIMFFVGEKFGAIKLASLVDCGHYFYEKKDLEKAIKYYRRALTLDPDYYYANIGLARALVVNKSFTESLHFFKKAASTKKPDLLTLLLLLIAYEGLSEDDSAKEVFKKILEYFNNNQTAAYDRLSYTCFELNMFKEAEHYVKEALKISPNEAGLHYNLGKIYFSEEILAEAQREFQKALELTSVKSEKRLRKYINYYLKDINKKKDIGRRS
jgi:tetratricopeptide (TPR) repeat protein